MAWNEEFQVAAVGAVFAGLGYFGKMVMDWRQERRKERAELIAQLHALQSLLKASGALFTIQHEQVEALMVLLKQNHLEEYNEGDGYDETLTRCYPVMNTDERERHEVIRAYSEFSMRKVNQGLSEWCAADRMFKSAVARTSRRRELARELFALEIHLTLWHAKYESWIPGHPERGLVYLADVKKHGLGFPREAREERNGLTVLRLGVEAEVAGALQELATRWK